MLTRLTAACAVLTGLLAAAAGGEAAFRRRPTAVKAGGKVTVRFAVSRPTDVAVFIEDASGEIVRHLAAGMLGDNAPAPLMAGSLAQSVVWDGADDDGRPAGAGPFKVRVAAGMKVRYAGTAFAAQAGPNHIVNVQGLVPGPDGRVYVLADRSGWLYWRSTAVHVFRRGGAYERTIKPFPWNLPLKRVRATGAFINSAGRLNPLIHRVLGMTYYPYEDEPRQQPALTPAGRLVLATVPAQGAARGDRPGLAPHLSAIDTDGGTPFAAYAGPVLKGKTVFSGYPYLQSSPDGKRIYISGLATRYYDKGYKRRTRHAVYAAPMPQRGPAKLLFGDPQQAGHDKAHLNEPRGVACDGKGHLFVADSGNNRVVVLNEPDGSFAGALAVAAPGWVGVHPRTGAVYVHSGDAVVKFSGWRRPKELARLDVSGLAKGISSSYRHHYRLSFALDGSSAPPVLWVGRSYGKGPPLFRVEDRGGRFGELSPVGAYTSPKHWRPAADPTKAEIACRIGGNWGSVLKILNEKTGKVRVLKGAVVGSEGRTHRLGPDGSIYGADHAMGIIRYDRDGKWTPFESTAGETDRRTKGRLPDKAGATGTTAWERDFYVDRRGDIYLKKRGKQYHGLMTVQVYGQDGRLKRTVLWSVTDGAYGPRVDSQGNLYIMEALSPPAEPYPPEFAKHLAGRWYKHWYDWMYGSVVKFGPAGGALWVPRNKRWLLPFDGKPGLDASLKKVKVHAALRGESQLQGALWYVPGFSQLGDMAAGGGGGEHCHCTGCDFDIDEFGRVFAPDVARFRVAVLDTNGNRILQFGGYGNQDCLGPDSYVSDPTGKFLRPRRQDDPDDVVAPFARPEIAFNWIIGLAVTDRYVYVADTANRRILRCRIGYAAEATAEVK